MKLTADSYLRIGIQRKKKRRLNNMQLEDNLTDQEGLYLRDRLDEFNAPYAGARNTTDIGFVVRDDDGQVLAGLIGSCVWEWLHVNVIWVSDLLRGQGYGTQLLMAAETEALKQNREFSMLNTFSFQARPFYERSGYKVISEMKDFPKGHSQFRMIKQLNSH